MTRFEDPRHKRLREDRERLLGKRATVVRGRYKGRGGTIDQIFIGHGGHIVARFIEDDGRPRHANADRMETDPRCPCGEMTIDDCAGECGRLEHPADCPKPGCDLPF